MFISSQSFAYRNARGGLPTGPRQLAENLAERSIHDNEMLKYLRLINDKLIGPL